MQTSQQPTVIAFAAYDEVNLLDIAGPLEAFNMLAKGAGHGEQRYVLTVVSPNGGAVRTSNGLVVDTVPCASLDRIDTLIVPGGGMPDAPTVPAEMIAWIAQVAPDVRRLCSVCTGAFLLGAAGQLVDKRATTHWAAASLLRDRAPQTTVEDDQIFVRDGQVWTCAGVTAGIDLALALIEDDHGFTVAMNIARYLVVYVRRPGSQAQFSKPFSLQLASDDSFATLHSWVRENLAEELSVERLAEIAGMSPRTFSRRYRAKTGRTPARTVSLLRVEAAQNAITVGALSLKRIARDYGFGDERNLRRALLREGGDGG